MPGGFFVLRMDQNASELLTNAIEPLSGAHEFTLIEP
jgi:hypothetical protein